MQTTLEDRRSSWLDKPIFNTMVINRETLAFVIILALAVITRFYNLEARVMSHDENTHVYYSWKFSKGQGLAHDPLMHGPFQFHLIALSYYIFGDNDFTARIPAALFSIAAIGFMWFYRRYLGKSGALIAAVLFLISPYMLFYGRYVRNEVYSAFFGVVMLWAILRYIDTGKPFFMYIVTLVNVLHFTAKETSFIYAAQALLFLAGYFVYRVSSIDWPRPNYRKLFLISLILTLLFVGGVGTYALLNRGEASISGTETASPAVPGQELTPLPPAGPPELVIVLGVLGLLSLLAAAFFLIMGYGWNNLRKERSFSLLIVIGTLVLPHLSAFPIRLLGWEIPTNAAQVEALTVVDIRQMAYIVIPLILISIAIGLLWNVREWLINAAIFYALFGVIYTSLFTNGAGFVTGLVGSLGYWLEQQGVNRGSQPWYYYWLVQIPVYEYLPALGAWLTIIIATVRNFSAPRHKKLQSDVVLPLSSTDEEEYNDLSVLEPAETKEERAPVLWLLGFWSITSLVAYSIAGEKMPWLTVHIALPLILYSSWGFGQLVDSIDWNFFKERRGWLILVLVPVFVLSFSSSMGSLLGTNPPFQGKELVQLQATSNFLTSFIAMLFSGYGLFYAIKPWSTYQLFRLLLVSSFAVLGFFTARTAIQSSFINYDNANELLVYAHSAGGVKQALAQIEEISLRTTNGLGIRVAYDSDTSYPYWWYLRNYNNSLFYGSNPTRGLREAPVVLVGDSNFGKIEAALGNAYDRFDYFRLWWPNQDYYNLTWERIRDALLNREMRAALFQIWLNRDYTLYGKVTERDLSLSNWSPAARMRLYIRKDIISKIWNYGAAPTIEEVVLDPFEGKQERLSAEIVFGTPGTMPGQFQHPRDLAVAADGTLYVADSDNHRIQHLDRDGTVIDVWGSFGDVAAGTADEGTFNQPWGVAVGPDGSVYVADTWNHRIQKFTSDGKFLLTWGYFGQAEQPSAFWGPRDIVVDDDGQVFITDTGNKRVVVFDEDGNYITQFGRAGLGLGEFDEPVGLAIGPTGEIYVADTWNQRIQVFTESEGGNYRAIRSWELVAWFGQSLDNKPYIAVDNLGNVFAVEPEGYRILQFTEDGEAIRFWGDFGASLDTFGMPASIAVDQRGGVWVSDAGNGRIMYFILPTQ